MALLSFYRGTGVDSRGRSMDEILGWDDEALERVHDFIQWLFPLDEPSAFNPNAPLLSPADRDAFHQDPRLAANLRRAFTRMLAFYGFALEDASGRPMVIRAASWDVRRANWMHANDHNHLRLTRILKSLMRLGQPELALALYERLLTEANDAGPGRISPTTIRYWKDAIR